MIKNYIVSAIRNILRFKLHSIINIGGLAFGILDTPIIKAKLAIVIKKLQKRGINIKPTDAAIALGLFQTGRAEEVINK